MSVQRKLSQRGWGQRVSECHKTQGSGPQAPCHVNDLWKAVLIGRDQVGLEPMGLETARQDQQ